MAKRYVIRSPEGLYYDGIHIEDRSGWSKDVDEARLFRARYEATYILNFTCTDDLEVVEVRVSVDELSVPEGCDPDSTIAQTLSLLLSTSQRYVISKVIRDFGWRMNLAAVNELRMMLGEPPVQRTPL